ncbi:hypothetical protein JYP51_19920 [Ponticoccus gilvus]|nr:hypothetical protein [Enemella evansiae]
MAASPADPQVDPFRGGRLLRGSGAPGPASVDHAGLRLVFVPPAGAAGRFALDVERRDAALSPETEAVLRQIDAAAPPLLTWTRIEVAAKLTGRPAHLVLRAARAAGLPPGIETRQLPDPTHWISLGWSL